ncbi:MAG: hypothetical protein H7A23_04560 [Leptospiraceae bacterium]|nr:hypothetical protein [Leptospiraceae bacterium]MCP5493806.1 hypothetical protein [Leptospiraceae bacterium]
MGTKSSEELLAKFNNNLWTSSGFMKKEINCFIDNEMDLKNPGKGDVLFAFILIETFKKKGEFLQETNLQFFKGKVY